MLNLVIKKISEQQKSLDESSPAYCVGEQLKGICASSSKCAELILRDLDVEAMSIEKASEKLKEYADNLQRENGLEVICITPAVADKILREFYRLPFVESVQIEEPSPTPSTRRVNLEDFL